MLHDTSIPLVDARRCMQLLTDIAEWALLVAGAVLVVGLVVFAALAFRLHHPPRD
jgi:hypothetical protein